MKKNQNENQEATFDLKHDTMEFSAATDGEDILDEDKEGYEADEISAEELEALNDTDANEAAALIEEQNDFQIDESNLPEEEWTDDIEDDKDEEEENIRR